MLLLRLLLETNIGLFILSKGDRIRINPKINRKLKTAKTVFGLDIF
jgi:hypothetical protein